MKLPLGARLERIYDGLHRGIREVPSLVCGNRHARRKETRRDHTENHALHDSPAFRSTAMDRHSATAHDAIENTRKHE